MKYLGGSFSVCAPGTDAYREGWERTFGGKHNMPTKNYRLKARKLRKSQCASGSIRTLKRGSTLVRICCPRGPKHWNRKAKRCRVGMRTQAVLKRKH